MTTSNGLLSDKARRVLTTLVPALLIAALTIYVMGFRPPDTERATFLPGKPLAAHDDLYPISVNETGALYLDKDRFVAAIEYFSRNPNPHAIADLVYLGNSNNVTLLLPDAAKAQYVKLAEQPDYGSLKEVNRQKDRVFQAYKDIVNGIGQTFAGTPIEIVLHDTRNPLKSIVAIQNPISGRRLGDTNTNFGIQLIKNYSQHEGMGQGAAFVSYGLTLKDGRKIKSTTVPLFHETYGLIGFICMNIDISKMDGKDPMAVDLFIENFKAIAENEQIAEMIQNSKKKK